MKLFILEHAYDANKKCGGCNNECCTYYGLGRTTSEAAVQFSGDEVYGTGLCAHCMCDVMLMGHEITAPREALREDDLAGMGDTAFDDMIEEEYGEEEGY